MVGFIGSNLLAACTEKDDALNQVYNIAFGERTTLNELFFLIRERVAAFHPGVKNIEPVYRDFRPGDVRHSLADIGKAKRLLGYETRFSVRDGLDQAAEWYVKSLT